MTVLPKLLHLMYVEADLDTIESSIYLESCTARHFRDHIFSFFVVADAFRALECLSHSNFACIFLHRDLPTLNGIEALNILRTSRYEKAVVLVVEEHDSITIEEGLHLGFNGVLRKPYSSLQLSEVIARCSRIENVILEAQSTEFEI